MEHIRLKLVNFPSAHEMFRIISNMDQDLQIKACTFLWVWWTARNKINAGESNRNNEAVSHRLAVPLSDFQQLRKEKCRVSGR
uniref:Uncharacterized protein n=1 Tax=Arundo donax TaxID=35708 RepID=A0A0A8ZWC9_ARUDO